MAKNEQRIKEALARVSDFDSFVSELLGDALDWPIQGHVEQIDDIGFAWTPAELEAEGLDAHILDGQVWQLTPGDEAQRPWGVFLLDFKNEKAFTKGRGIVGPLRQVLRGLVPRRTKASNLPSWQHENILFICTHKYQHFTFAHFKGDKHSSAGISTFGWRVGSRAPVEYRQSSYNNRTNRKDMVRQSSERIDCRPGYCDFSNHWQCVDKGTCIWCSGSGLQSQCTQHK